MPLFIPGLLVHIDFAAKKTIETLLATDNFQVGFAHFWRLLGGNVIFHNYYLMENETGSHQIMP
jgi:hypothetical protein